MMDDERAQRDDTTRRVGEWVSRLLAGTRDERLRAATELNRLGVGTRRSVRTRGSLVATAPSRLPAHGQVDAIAACLADADRAVRCQVALALGEWGGDEAVDALRRLWRSDDDEEVQLHAVTALRTIGGPAAAETLRQMALDGSDRVRDAAISAIEELATGGTTDDTEGAVPAPVPAAREEAAPVRVRGAVRTRGAIRTRGAVRSRGAVTPVRGGPSTDTIASSLRQIRDDPDTPRSLRLRAGEVLALFRTTG
jgi:HEAT repeat protein